MVVETEPCQACGVGVTLQVAETTTRLLHASSDEQRAKLQAAYGDAPLPGTLCAACFNAAMGVMNGASE